MSITFHEENTIGVWYVSGSVEGQGQDWLGHIGYETIDGKRKLVLTYRFRYYAEESTGNPFEDNDRKSWYRAESTNEERDPAVLIAAVRGMIRIIQARFGADSFDEILVKDFPSFKAFMEYFSDRPWSFVKYMSLEESKNEELIEDQ